MATAEPIDHRSRHRFRPTARLTEPLVRAGNGELRPASWDEALDRAVAGFRTSRDTAPVDRASPTASPIGVFSCSKSTNEMNFVAQKLARVALGTNNIDSCNRT